MSNQGTLRVATCTPSTAVSANVHVNSTGEFSTHDGSTAVSVDSAARVSSVLTTQTQASRVANAHLQALALPSQVGANATWESAASAWTSRAKPAYVSEGYRWQPISDHVPVAATFEFNFGTLTVATYNTFNPLWIDYAFSQRLNDRERCAACQPKSARDGESTAHEDAVFEQLQGTLAHVDVLGLQEISGLMVERLRVLARERNFTLFDAHQSGSDHCVLLWNATLTADPPHAAFSVYSADSDNPIVSVVFKLGDKRVRVIHTHVPGASEERDYRGGAELARYYDQLPKVSEEGSDIIIGDLNARPETLYPHFAAAGFERVACNYATHIAAPKKDFINEPHLAQYDHILYTGTARVTPLAPNLLGVSNPEFLK